MRRGYDGRTSIKDALDKGHPQIISLRVSSICKTARPSRGILFFIINNLFIDRSESSAHKDHAQQVRNNVSIGKTKTINIIDIDLRAPPWANVFVGTVFIMQRG